MKNRRITMILLGLALAFSAMTGCTKVDEEEQIVTKEIVEVPEDAETFEISKNDMLWEFAKNPDNYSDWIGADENIIQETYGSVFEVGPNNTPVLVMVNENNSNEVGRTAIYIVHKDEIIRIVCTDDIVYINISTGTLQTISTADAQPDADEAGDDDLTYRYYVVDKMDSQDATPIAEVQTTSEGEIYQIKKMDVSKEEFDNYMMMIDPEDSREDWETYKAQYTYFLK